jgi:hypothetical protein
MITMRNVVDGSLTTVADDDPARVKRLENLGYRVVDPLPLAKLPVEPIAKPKRKRSTKK